MIAGSGALDTVEVPALPPAADESAPGIGRDVMTGRPPNAVPSVLMNTSRRSDTVTPAGSRSEMPHAARRVGPQRLGGVEVGVELR